MKEPMTARHPLWFKISAYGIVLYLVTLLLMFLLSMLFNAVFPKAEMSDPQSYSLALSIVAVPLAAVAFLIAHSFCRPATERSAIALGLGWVGVQAVINVLIALANGNAGFIFSNFATYLPYAAVFAGALASRLHRDRAA